MWMPFATGEQIQSRNTRAVFLGPRSNQGMSVLCLSTRRVMSYYSHANWKLTTLERIVVTRRWSGSDWMYAIDDSETDGPMIAYGDEVHTVRSFRNTRRDPALLERVLAQFRVAKYGRCSEHSHEW